MQKLKYTWFGNLFKANGDIFGKRTHADSEFAGDNWFNGSLTNIRGF